MYKHIVSIPVRISRKVRICIALHLFPFRFVLVMVSKFVVIAAQTSFGLFHNFIVVYFCKIVSDFGQFYYLVPSVARISQTRQPSPAHSNIFQPLQEERRRRTIQVQATFRHSLNSPQPAAV